MDYGLISKMIRSHANHEFHERTTFHMYNLVVKFGKETEYPVIKFILRIFYKELKHTFDEKGERISGKITDERLREMVYILEKLVHDYYFMMRFK